MKLFENLEIVGLNLWLEKEKTLVFGDIHIGYEEDLNRKGVMVPRLQTKEILDSVKKVLKDKKPEKIILLGDLKHEFGRISRQEWKDITSLLEIMLEKSKVVLVKGNHDNILEPIVKKKNLEVKEYYSMKELLFCHGDKLIDEKNPGYKKAKIIIIAHEHPAISIKDGPRVEKYKCFLIGKHKNKNLVVMPSFNRITEGTDVMKEKLLSPFLKNVQGFRAIVVADKVYDFGIIRNLKKIS